MSVMAAPAATEKADTLRKEARCRYGRSACWPDIYRAAARLINELDARVALGVVLELRRHHREGGRRDAQHRGSGHGGSGLRESSQPRVIVTDRETAALARRCRGAGRAAPGGGTPAARSRRWAQRPWARCGPPGAARQRRQRRKGRTGPAFLAGEGGVGRASVVGSGGLEVRVLS